MADAMRAPDGTIDSHCHVFDPARFPYDPGRSYTPGTATAGELQAVHARLGVSRVVLVQPSVYGTDNGCLLDSLVALPNARGIAVIDPATVTDEELRALQAAGVVGVRVNLGAPASQAEAALEAVSQALARVAPFGLLVQLYVDLPLVAVLANVIAASPVPVVLDHLGGALPDQGTGHPSFGTLLMLLAAGKVWVKLSASHRTARDEASYSFLEPIVRALIGTNPDRVVWGSDWPHTGGTARSAAKPGDIELFRAVDDASILSQLLTWTPDMEIRRKLFVDNPARLFRF